MSILTTQPAAQTALEYCRRARRIRASFHRDPFLRHQALSDLAGQRNIQTQTASQINLRCGATASPLPLGSGNNQIRLKTSQRRIAPYTTIPDQIERDFTDQVSAKLQPFGFTFSDRLKLLNNAEKMGINRFRANVILATYEHQAARPVIRAAGKPIIPFVAVIFVIEIMVVLAFVWVCVR